MYDAVVTETPAFTATSDNVDLRRLDNAPLPAPGRTDRRTLWNPKLSVTFRIGCLTRPRTERNDPADSFQQ